MLRQFTYSINITEAAVEEQNTVLNTQTTKPVAIDSKEFDPLDSSASATAGQSDR